MVDWIKTLAACGVKAMTAARWAPIFARHAPASAFSKGAGEVDDFLGQILHESNKLESLEEGLSYSAERLMAVWPSRFPSLGAATPYARNPQALANKVYGGRLGNTGPNDGWLYRGSGLIQCTGKDNFYLVGNAIGVDLVANPDLLRADPGVALRASIAWWERRVPDSAMGDPRAVRRAVNGGTIGLDDATRLTKLADGSDGRMDGAVS